MSPLARSCSAMLLQSVEALSVGAEASVTSHLSGAPQDHQIGGEKLLAQGLFNGCYCKTLPVALDVFTQHKSRDVYTKASCASLRSGSNAGMEAGRAGRLASWARAYHAGGLVCILVRRLVCSCSYLGIPRSS